MDKHQTKKVEALERRKYHNDDSKEKKWNQVTAITIIMIILTFGPCYFDAVTSSLCAKSLLFLEIQTNRKLSDKNWRDISEDRTRTSASASASVSPRTRTRRCTRKRDVRRLQQKYRMFRRQKQHGMLMMLRKYRMYRMYRMCRMEGKKKCEAIVPPMATEKETLAHDSSDQVLVFRVFDPVFAQVCGVGDLPLPRMLCAFCAHNSVLLVYSHGSCFENVPRNSLLSQRQSNVHFLLIMLSCFL